jgi:HTH-type transcriptional regulator/antitoxin HigA
MTTTNRCELSGLKIITSHWEDPMAIRKPAEVFPPGEFLRDELEERGWTQTDLAQIMNRSATVVNEIIVGRRGISPETARGLSAALGTTPELWMNLESAYQLSRLRDDDNDAIARRARLYSIAPVKDMIRRGWIEPSDNVAVLETRVLKFFDMSSADDEPDWPAHAARKATPYSQAPTPAQKAWLHRVAQLAGAVHTKAFSKHVVNDVVADLRLLMHQPQEVRRVPRLLSDAGIKFVIVEPLPSTKIDGACLWMDDQPVIALTLRFNRLDNFWFVLLHELAHVRQEIRSLDIELDATWGDLDEPDTERDASEFATENLVPQDQLDSFIARVRPLYSARRVEAFAQTMQVHPAIVVGQLQHRREIQFSSLRNKLVPVRDYITGAALTDGWGAALPADL